MIEKFFDRKCFFVLYKLFYMEWIVYFMFIWYCLIDGLSFYISGKYSLETMREDLIKIVLVILEEVIVWNKLVDIGVYRD